MVAVCSDLELTRDIPYLTLLMEELWVIFYEFLKEWDLESVLYCLSYRCQVGGLMQEIFNSSALAMELHRYCIKPSKFQSKLYIAVHPVNCVDVKSVG